MTGPIERAIEHLNFLISDGLRSAEEEANRDGLESVQWSPRLRTMMAQRATLKDALDVAATVLGERFAQPIANPFEVMTSPDNPRFSFRVGIDPDGGFDELVVGDWLHIECMGCHNELPDGSDDPNGAMSWWARIGDAWIWISVPHEGEPTVSIDRGQYGDVLGTTNTRGRFHRFWWRCRLPFLRLRWVLAGWVDRQREDVE